MHLRQIEPPAAEPVTLEEAKPYLRLDGSEENNLVTSLITAARQLAEQFTRRSFITQKWELSLKSVACGGKVELLRPPVQRIEAVTLDGVSVPAENYVLLGLDTFYAKIALAATDPAGLVIQYVAGYGDSAAYVPEPIRQAVLMLVAHLYENRGNQVDIPPAVRSLLWCYRVVML